MNKIIDCPNCLGIGEISNGKVAKTCKICKGEGKVDPIIESAYIKKLKILE